MKGIGAQNRFLETRATHAMVLLHLHLVELVSDTGKFHARISIWGIVLRASRKMDKKIETKSRIRKYNYIIYGNIIPENVHIILDIGRGVYIEHSKSKISGVLKFSINGNKFQGNFRSDSKIYDYATMKNILSNKILAFLEVFSFKSGFNIDLYLYSIFDQNKKVFVNIVPVIQEVSDFPNIKSGSDLSGAHDFGQDLDLAFRSLEFSLAISDYCKAMRYPGETGFFCERAIESLAHYFGDMGSTSSIGKSKSEMRRVLKISKETSSYITRKSAARRHGAGVWESGQDRVDMLVKTKIIINRFFDLLNGVSLENLEEI